jgi:hypothetical protein
MTGAERTADRRHAVDLAPSDRRPRVALLLALLAVPGSTIAWELPLGGFWIGLPLAVAAIVTGVRGRPSLVATAAIVIASLAIAQMVVWTIVSAVS